MVKLRKCAKLSSTQSCTYFLPITTSSGPAARSQVCGKKPGLWRCQVGRWAKEEAPGGVPGLKQEMLLIETYLLHPVLPSAAKSVTWP